MYANQRSAIAAAANTVDGITVTEYFRQTTTPGQGYVVFERADRDDTGFGLMVTWSILIFLPSDFGSSEVFEEGVLPSLIAALASELRVSTITHASVNLDGSAVPCVVIEGVRGDAN